MISIHALREEGDFEVECGGNVDKSISIHALREEGDTRRAYCLMAEPISIHALREEGDTVLRAASMRGLDFYPRPPRGGRRLLFGFPLVSRSISIHALREEGDS